MGGLQAYTFASVFVAHAADGKLQEEELLVVRRNVHRAARSLGYSSMEVEAMLIDTINGYWKRLDQDGPQAVLADFQDNVRIVTKSFAGTPDTLHAIQRDLLDIARADGDVSDMEDYLIQFVGELWDQQHA